jgi:7-cyano-7-deazaguanine synthase
MTNAPTVVLLSGGVDSTAALTWSHDHQPVALALSVDYGQRHKTELQAAAAVAKHFDVDHVVIDLRGYGTLTRSALTGGGIDVPEGGYDKATMARTVVPGRNSVFLSAAVGIAESVGAGSVVIGVHAGDHYVYPDCRPAYIEAMRAAMLLASDGAVGVEAPFLHMDKEQVVLVGSTIEAPFHLTYSCYNGGPVHCGRCGTCVERAKAFDRAGVTDPTTYTDPDYWKGV